MEKEQRESVEDFIDKLLEKDDEFPEFDIDADCFGKERGKETAAKWKEDEWDEDDAKDDFSLQLKKELENSSKKDGAAS